MRPIAARAAVRVGRFCSAGAAVGGVAARGDAEELAFESAAIPELEELDSTGVSAFDSFDSGADADFADFVAAADKGSSDKLDASTSIGTDSLASATETRGTIEISRGSLARIEARVDSESSMAGRYDAGVAGVGALAEAAEAGFAAPTGTVT